MNDGRAGTSQQDLLEPTLVFGGGRTSELNISGSHVLLALATGVCLASPLVWVFVNYWLFAL